MLDAYKVRDFLEAIATGQVVPSMALEQPRQKDKNDPGRIYVRFIFSGESHWNMMVSLEVLDRYGYFRIEEVREPDWTITRRDDWRVYPDNLLLEANEARYCKVFGVFWDIVGTVTRGHPLSRGPSS